MVDSDSVPDSSVVFSEFDVAVDSPVDSPVVLVEVAVLVVPELLLVELLVSALGLGSPQAHRAAPRMKRAAVEGPGRVRCRRPRQNGHCASSIR